MESELDPAKNAANIAKHGIDFSDAIGVFVAISSSGPTFGAITARIA
jgi:uncharacterized DUF497 family protein